MGTGRRRFLLIALLLALAMLLFACEEPPGESGVEEPAAPAQGAEGEEAVPPEVEMEEPEFEEVPEGEGGAVGGEGPTAQVESQGSPERLTVIPETTEVLPPALTEAYLADIAAGGETITFDQGVLQRVDLSPGNVLAIEPTALAPEGLLRRVVRTSTQNGQVQVQTEQGTLEEAIESGFVEAHVTLTPDDAQESSFWSGTLRPVATHPAALANTFFLRIDETLASGVRVRGEVTFQPSFDFSVAYDNGRLQNLTILNTTRQTGRLELTGTVASASFDKKVSILPRPIRFKPIVIPIGIFPIWLTPQLDVFVGAEGRLSAQITTAVNQDVTFETGFVYEAGRQPQLINNSSGVALDFKDPTFSAGAEARTYLRPQLDVRIYGVTGPYVAADAYVKLVAGPTRTPLWEVTGGVKGTAGVKVKIVGRILAGYEATLFDLQWPIMQAAAAPGPGQANVFEVEAMLSPPPPALVEVQAPITASVDFGMPFAAIDEICFIFFFEMDPFYELLDPGDELTVGPFPTTNNPAFGFTNNTSQMQADRTICLAPGDPIIDLFLDGREDFGIEMQRGGVLIGGLFVQINGVP